MDPDYMMDDENHNRPSAAHRVLMHYLPNVQQWTRVSQPGSCYITEIALLLIHLLEQLPITVQNVVFQGEVQKYARDNINTRVHVDGMFDIDDVDSLDEKHLALKDMVTELKRCTAEIRHVWNRRHNPNPNAEPPRRESRRRESLSESDEAQAGSSFMPEGSGYAADRDRNNEQRGRQLELLIQEEQAHNLPSDEDVEDEDIEEIIMTRINQVRGRGRGHYVCPLGAHCRIGGNDDFGQPVMFELNSAFRDHLQRHLKGFKCDSCGKGFGRQSNLDRHIEHIHKRNQDS